MLEPAPRLSPKPLDQRTFGGADVHEPTLVAVDEADVLIPKVLTQAGQSHTLDPNRADRLLERPA